MTNQPQTDTTPEETVELLERALSAIAEHQRIARTSLAEMMTEWEMDRDSSWPNTAERRNDEKLWEAHRSIRSHLSRRTET